MLTATCIAASLGLDIMTNLEVLCLSVLHVQQHWRVCVHMHDRNPPSDAFRKTGSQSN